MIKTERKIQILNLILQKESVSVDELAKTFETSPSTIRRELKAMEDSNLIKRTHGGAIIAEAKKENIAYYSKKVKHYFQKSQIAIFAATLVEDNDYILIGSSSITHLMVNYIRAKNVTIITNSLNVANIVKNKDNLQLIMLGGYYFKSAETIEGVILTNQINEMHFKKAFLGADGVDFDFGISTITEIELASKIAAIRNSNTTYFLCESAKFNIKKTHRIIELSQSQHIITDNKLDQTLLDKYSTICDIIIAPTTTSSKSML